MAKPMVVNGILFQTKKSLEETIRGIVASYKNEQTLKDEDKNFIVALIENQHPQAEAKIGPGIARIIVRQNPIYTHTRGFHLFRVDGTDTDVSWTECLRPTPHHKKVRRAMRFLVESQTRAFKQEFFDIGESPYCQITGELINFTDSHVDHVPPLTFDQLVENFFTELQLDINSIGLRGDQDDNKYVDLLDDDKLADRWQEYHLENANLRVISQFANLSIVKNG